MDDHANFKRECIGEIQQQGDDRELKELTLEWVTTAAKHKYSYHFEWLGRPIIQHPQDVVGMQQLLWNVRPDLIIETGVARGGSLIFYASILELIAACGGNADARVLGIDIDIREHNRTAITSHPMSKRIDLIQGSSIDQATADAAMDIARRHKKVMVCLDSNHTREHVEEELRLYAPFVSKGSYCVVFDTIIDDLPESLYPDRPWGKSNNPKIAVLDFLKQLETGEAKSLDGLPMKFEIDKQIENQLLITVAPSGFLLRV
uniref:Cephalosporin hydroxylase n=1 Tax=Rhodopseudomonas palustris (strain BisA53) TaxID=316055 RepID=Q07IR3_RHOP5